MLNERDFPLGGNLEDLKDTTCFAFGSKTFSLGEDDYSLSIKKAEH